ncbi:metallophosphoesterase [Glycocaulis profundi]|nr:metallophosphoesterase [Glycocaulis profundi]
MTRIIHIADLHFGAEEPRLVETLAEEIEDLKPDVVVAAGDLTQYGRRREFAAAREFFDGLSAPVVASPGNHDVPYGNMFSRLLSPWARFNHHMQGRVEARYADDRVAIETFETARGAQLRLDWSLGRARPDQAREIAGRLESAAPGDGVRIVACHHPLIAPGGPKGRAKTKFGAEAADVFLAGGADMVLSGHLHTAFAIPDGREGHKCWFVGVSTALSHRTREEPAGFNLIDIDHGEGRLAVYAADDDRRFSVFEEKSLDWARA